jgi:hypothetical protein
MLLDMRKEDWSRVTEVDVDGRKLRMVMKRDFFVGRVVDVDDFDSGIGEKCLEIFGKRDGRVLRGECNAAASKKQQPECHGAETEKDAFGKSGFDSHRLSLSADCHREAAQAMLLVDEIEEVLAGIEKTQLVATGKKERSFANAICRRG